MEDPYVGNVSASRIERGARDTFSKKIPHFGGPKTGRIAGPKLWAISICLIQKIITN